MKPGRPSPLGPDPDQPLATCRFPPMWEEQGRVWSTGGAFLNANAPIATKARGWIRRFNRRLTGGSLGLMLIRAGLSSSAAHGRSNQRRVDRVG
jgi:hypothetical protein